MGNIPEEAKEILKEHLDLLESKLPNLLEVYYIYGSISLGAFNYGMSDIDFIVVIKRKVTEIDINILKEIHREIKKKFPKTDLMGLYVMKHSTKTKKHVLVLSMVYIKALKNLIKIQLTLIN